MLKFFRRFFQMIFRLIILIIFILVGINFYMIFSVSSHIVTVEEASLLEDNQCILVLGASVLNPTTPSKMLADRLDTAICLYENHSAPKILMSGDHGTSDYNEVGTMKHYAVAHHVPSEDIFLDHAGFSTYESMYRAKEIFGCKKIIVVTQRYHLYRAMYIGKSLGMDVYGVPATENYYIGQSHRELREIVARCKDFISSFIKPLPTYLGEPISLDGNGDNTNSN